MLNKHMVNGTRWEALEDIAHKIQFDMLGVKQSDAYKFYLWERYKRSSRSERTKIVKEIREFYTYMAELEKSINMIGLLLFGPQHGSTIMRSSRVPGLPDWECLRSTVELFEKHCGLITEHAMGHLIAFANICIKLVDKEAVEEAFKLTCSTMINIPYGTLASD
ncbi:asparaginyl endopeptidase 1 [Artemisia annua]|uniref:Asparaginyl endopeptidase 1 n=1 Tax=Artemisia annua TaxID=35608 RepID=A0A2U1LFC5_ARTAN|nr:asparaginyl endopeptidase 1 [Artemisia annua]